MNFMLIIILILYLADNQKQLWSVPGLFQEWIVAFDKHPISVNNANHIHAEFRNDSKFSCLLWILDKWLTWIAAHSVVNEWN